MIEIEITVRRDGRKFHHETATGGTDTGAIYSGLQRGSAKIMRAIDSGWCGERSEFDTPHIEAE